MTKLLFDDDLVTGENTPMRYQDLAPAAPPLDDSLSQHNRSSTLNEDFSALDK
jgi:hypothetical protein